MKQIGRPRTQFAALVALIVGATLAISACSSSGTASPKSAPARGAAVISVKSLMFMPEVLTVKVGTAVTWRNDEPITHTVTSGEVTGVDKTTGLRSGQKPDGRFGKTLKGTGATFSYTFTAAGTYSYYCNIHFGMSGKVVVTG
jgi:plastocyanin